MLNPKLAAVDHVIGGFVSDQDSKRRFRHITRLLELNGHPESADFIKQLVDLAENRQSIKEEPHHVPGI